METLSLRAQDQVISFANLEFAKEVTGLDVILSLRKYKQLGFFAIQALEIYIAQVNHIKFGISQLLRFLSCNVLNLLSTFTSSLLEMTTL